MYNNGRVLEMQLGSYEDYIVDRDGCMVRKERPINAQTKIAVKSAGIANNKAPNGWQIVENVINS